MRRLVIVTGLSGAGKSQAMKSFEDFGFACLDNAPPVLARPFVALAEESAPVYSSDSLHSAVVEIIVKKNARCRYTTIQNWSNNVYNLVTKRAVAQAGATMEWIDSNIRSKVTMKYPAVWLVGEHAKGETLSVAFAGEGQHQDAGSKMVHAAPNTSSTIVSKSVARGAVPAARRPEGRGSPAPALWPGDGAAAGLLPRRHHGRHPEDPGRPDPRGQDRHRHRRGPRLPAHHRRAGRRRRAAHHD